MQDWDRLVMVIVGAGVALSSLVGGYKSWRAQQRSAAVGALLLAVMTLALPVALALFGG